MDRDMKINLIIVLLIISFLSIIYILGGGIGFALAVITIAIIYGLISKLNLTYNLTIIGIIITVWLGFVVSLYILGGPNLGLMVLASFTGGILLVAILVAYTSDSNLKNLRSTRYKSRYESEKTYHQRTCVVCGRRLVTGRKYCYLHKPWKQRGYTEYYKEEFTPKRSRQRYTNKIGSGRKSSGNLFAKPKKSQDLIGNTYSNKTLEHYVGKQKKKRYF